MELRQGKTKSILESSLDSALLAVEIYNKPRTTFRSEGFITMMIIAWTRLFHAHFNVTIGDKYFYRQKKNKTRYELVDGEKKAWELATCIKKYGDLDAATESNLTFFVKLRNKIEHRHIEKREVDTLIFGECQSLLYNYETTLIKLFGENYSINEALVYSLQFSQIRTSAQEKSSKSALSKDLTDIVSFVEKYRTALDDAIYNTQEYSIKLIQIPKISNTNRAEAAIEFVKWDSLNPEDRAAYERLNVLVKDKTVKVEASNVGKLKPSDVVNKVNEGLTEKTINQSTHVVLYKLFKIRPTNGSPAPFETQAEFCHYDEPHDDYVYQNSWVSFLINFLESTEYTASDFRQKLKNKEYLEVNDFR